MAESFHTDADLTGAGEHHDAIGLNLGETYLYQVNGQVTGVRFRSPVVFSGGSNEVALYQTTDDDPPVSSGAGTLLGSAAVTGYVPDSWVVQDLPAPVAVRPGIPYRPVWFNSVGRYRALGAFFSSGEITRSYITAIRDNVPTAGFDLHNGTYLESGALAYTKDSFNAAAYFVDTVFEPDHLRVRPGWVPELPSSAGLYAFGHDIVFSEAPTIWGLYWYQPVGTVADVTATLYDQATQAVLATGSILAGDLLTNAWNFVPLDAPYAGSAGVIYTMAAQTDGTHGYDNSVSLPVVSPDGLAEIIQTRYESGGGYPFTDWGSGMHALDTAYTIGGAPAPAQGTLNTGLNLATGLTGARTSAGVLGAAIALAPALTGSAPHGGILAGTLDLAPALAGARASRGAVHAGLGLSLSLAGARASLGALHAGLTLSPALNGARRSLGVLAASLRLQLALTGSDGQAGRAVTPWPVPPEPVDSFPHPSGPAGGFPWPPRPVRSYQEVAE